VGVTPVELKEIVYQAVPYVGMATVFDFLYTTNNVLTERGVELPLPGQSTTTPQTRLERGLAVQKQIVGGDRVDAMYACAPADEQHVQRYLSANCFGDHLTRLASTCPNASCSPSPCWPPPWVAARPRSKGHVAGNLNVGNDRAGCCPCSPCSSRSSAIPAPSTPWRHSTSSPRPTTQRRRTEPWQRAPGSSPESAADSAAN
jgi:4-carboxymuconolactone decarboxylase